MATINPLILDHMPTDIDKLVNMIHKHSIVIIKNVEFKKKTDMLNFCKQFGKLHPYQKQYLTCISNNYKFGDTRVGSVFWHIDGEYSKYVNKFSFQYILNCPVGQCGTQFIKSNFLVDQLDKKWHNMYAKIRVPKNNSGDKDEIIHPIIAQHPVTGENYLVACNLVTENIIEYDDDGVVSKIYDAQETQKMFKEIHDLIDQNKNYIHVPNFEKGDLLIRDNLSLLHKSHPSAQISHDKIGLRRIWRVVIAGDKPKKLIDK